MAPRMLIAGNWKMNGLKRSARELDRLARALERAGRIKPEVLICPPATLIAAFAERAKKTPVSVGGQDCHPQASGAHTGDISAAMLKDAGAKYVIVGHSERRADHGETDALVAAKAAAAHEAGLKAIICVGETEAERDNKQTLRVISRQLSGSVPDGATARNTVIAYEPVWAIGTGKTPTPEDVAEVHAHIRKRLEKSVGGEAARMRLLYGGSVKPANAAELLSVANVNGALVGGASLKAADFFGIIETAV